MACICVSSTANLKDELMFSRQVDLPIEIVIYIMEFLPLSDRISASQVCRTWYEASCDLKLHRNEIVVLHDNLTNPIAALVPSSGTFINFLFKEVELNSKLNAFWEKFCPQIQYLGLSNCILSEKMFVDILSRCHHLESLIINNCRELLMSGRILETEAEVLFLQQVLVNLRVLSITHNRYMSDAIFYRFVSIAPNLQQLDLSGCQISYHNGLYKKFYPVTLIDETNCVLSESVLTFNVILRYIRDHAQRIKVLKLGHTFIDNSALTQLAKTPGLALKALDLPSCDQLTNTGLSDLVSYQTSLTHLDVNGCSRLTDHALIAICHNLVNLEALNLRNCRAITNIGVAELANSEKLQYLNLAQCEMVTGEGIVKGLCQRIRHLKKLNLCALLMDEDSVCQVAENLPDLQYLDLSWCFNAVTDRSMQAICTHLIFLTTLKLSSCNKISDIGVTGLKSDGAPDVSDVESKNDELVDPLHRINLRTQAEREIVRDAKRKNIAFSKCVDSETFSGLSLGRLKGLQHLDLSGCNRITDVGLVYALHFVGLRFLDLSRCQQITHFGLSALSENNPSLEILIMNDCFNVTDEAVLVLVKQLRRLKYLDVQGCNNLTDASIQAIGDHCLCLQYLNVNNCVRMTVNAVLQLQKTVVSLLSVHHLNLKNEADSIENEMNFVPPPPPPPPSKRKIFRFF